MAMEDKQSKFKILMFPWLAHGHVFPFLELSKRLSATNYFDIYLCSTPANLDSIKSTLAKHTSNDDEDDKPVIKLVELYMPSSPELTPQLHTTKNLPSNLIPTLIKAFQDSSPSFSVIMDSVKPDLLIYDLLQPWAPKIAASKGIPCVYFSIFGATTLSFYQHIHKMGTASTFPHQAINITDPVIVSVMDRIGLLLKDADNDFAFGNFTRSTDIVLLKSCSDIEEKYRGYLSLLSKKQIVCTGPLISHSNEENSEISEWLSGKNQFSTVYISFGSEYFLSRNEIVEIAKGLQLCGANFLWVMRFPVGEESTSIEEVLPEGFLEIVKERGLVVPKWAPQAKILDHPSIGGFVSHCGWSSVIESMYFGVPVIAMSMKTDQPINAKMVVEAGCGVEVEKDGNGNYVGEEVAKAINKVISEKTFYEGLRDRAKKLSLKIKEKEEEEVNEAAEQLLRICMKNKK